VFPFLTFLPHSDHRNHLSARPSGSIGDGLNRLFKLDPVRLSQDFSLENLFLAAEAREVAMKDDEVEISPEADGKINWEFLLMSDVNAEENHPRKRLKIINDAVEGNISLPSDTRPSYQASSSQFFDKMMAFHKKAHFTLAELTHKRGTGFAAINAGLSYGNGHKRPTWLKHGAREAMVSDLLEDEDLQRLAAYQDG
jgi:hypothetical protein